MRFTATSVLALAAGAVATGSSSYAPSVTTEVITSYETYCPEATSFVAGGSTVHVSTPGTYTLSGSYTVTRPLLSSTVTVCNSCSATPSPSAFVSVAPSAPVPAGTGSPKPHSSVAANPGASSSTPAAPGYTGAASHVAAGAGAGLAAVFGAAAFLL